MNTRAILYGLGALALLVAVGTAGWIAGGEGGSADPAIQDAIALPIPPLPPRFGASERYDRCLAEVSDDPAKAAITASAWMRESQDPAGPHCLALAQLGIGQPAAAAALFERLAARPDLATPVRAAMFDQASQAWLLAQQPDAAYRAAREAVALAPDNPDLWVGRAVAALARTQYQLAVDDLGNAFARDPSRADILVRRAAALRMLDRPDAALADIERALTADPDNAEALLERGILRQRRNDPAGARADWERAILLAADSQTADLAIQDLALLEAGPIR